MMSHGPREHQQLMQMRNGDTNDIPLCSDKTGKENHVICTRQMDETGYDACNVDGMDVDVEKTWGVTDSVVRL